MLIKKIILPEYLTDHPASVHFPEPELHPAAVVPLVVPDPAPAVFPDPAALPVREVARMILPVAAFELPDLGALPDLEALPDSDALPDLEALPVLVLECRCRWAAEWRR